MEKSEKFRLIYSIFLGVFTVAVGIAIICVAADIYYSGKGADIIYSREIVGDRLLKLAIPIIFLIAAIIFGAIFPLYQVKAKRQPEDTLKKLRNKIPQSGEGQFSAARAAYKKATIVKLVAWLVALAVALTAAIVTLVYLVNTANFAGEEITEEIFAMVRNILPWLAASLGAAVAATVVCGVFANKQVAAAKTMIKTGDKSTCVQKQEPKFISFIKALVDKPAFVWAVRGALFVIAVVFIVLGIVNGGAKDVLIKAINICTECIGLG